LTGAAGALGRVLRPRLRARCRTLRLSDIVPLDAPVPGEEHMSAALEDRAQVRALLDGVDAVVHLGGISTEQSWDAILQANIVGAYHLYDAARVHGVRRIVFASSNHVTGFYRRNEVIGTDAPPRPDGLYGVSKAFGETLARMYHDRHGIETVALRIGSALPEPVDRRMLSTWLSLDDLERLVVSALTAPVAGFTAIYGMSDNAAAWWDNTAARHIGFRAQDSADGFRDRIEAQQPPVDPADPATQFQGGVFVRMGSLE